MAEDLPVLELEGRPEAFAWSRERERDDLEYRRRVCCRFDWKRWVADSQALACGHRLAFAPCRPQPNQVQPGPPTQCSVQLARDATLSGSLVYYSLQR